MRIFSTPVLPVIFAAILSQHAVAQGGNVSREALLGAPTPLTEQGHPDLNGIWVGGVPGAQEFRNAGPQGAFYAAGAADLDTVGTTFFVRDGNFFWAEIDQEIYTKSDRDNMPYYKSEYWEQVRYNEEYGYERPLDPGFGCRPVGIVKEGAPTEIIQLPNKMVFLYSGAPPAIREIPMDGRPLRVPDEYEGQHIMGHSVGHWDGDTLVVETVDFPDDMIWYSTRGWPQSAGTKITERYTRQGNVLRLEMTVDDPAFIKPWEVRPIERRPHPNPNALFPPSPLCAELDGDLISGADRFSGR